MKKIAPPKIGQRWLWNNEIVAEIISDNTNYPVKNAKVLLAKGQKKPYFCGIDCTFNIAYDNGYWFLLEGQDAPKD